MVNLDIMSDPICPWCYIGKSKLDQALSQAPDHPFTIQWHPYQLNPDMPAQGMDRREYLETKFGGQENAIKVYSKIAQAAEDEGLEIDFAAIKRTPNTLNAHRLIHWAGQEGVQTAVVSRLFVAYFKEGLDIGDSEILADIAKSTGMDRDVTLRLLLGNGDADDIRGRDAHSRKMGVTGVPTFIVANQHVLTGAQPADVWSKVISEINDQLKDTP